VEETGSRILSEKEGMGPIFLGKKIPAIVIDFP
jgi:hypothetical protein